MRSLSGLWWCARVSGMLASGLFAASAHAAISCSVSVPDIDFGTVNASENRVLGNPQLSVSCSGGHANGSLSYAVHLNYSGVMHGVSSDVIPYGLYKDSGRTMPWGNSGKSETVSFTAAGVSRSTTASRMTIYGEVLGANFRNVTPGAYTDTVTVVIEY